MLSSDLFRSIKENMYESDFRTQSIKASKYQVTPEQAANDVSISHPEKKLEITTLMNSLFGMQSTTPQQDTIGTDTRKEAITNFAHDFVQRSPLKGPLDRVSAFEQSLKQGSLDPLKESARKQVAETNVKDLAMSFILSTGKGDMSKMSSEQISKLFKGSKKEAVGLLHEKLIKEMVKRGEFNKAQMIVNDIEWDDSYKQSLQKLLDKQRGFDLKSMDDTIDYFNLYKISSQPEEIQKNAERIIRNSNSSGGRVFSSAAKEFLSKHEGEYLYRVTDPRHSLGVSWSLSKDVTGYFQDGKKILQKIKITPDIIERAIYADGALKENAALGREVGKFIKNIGENEVILKPIK